SRSRKPCLAHWEKVAKAYSCGNSGQRAGEDLRWQYFAGISIHSELGALENNREQQGPAPPLQCAVRVRFDFPLGTTTGICIEAKAGTFSKRPTQQTLRRGLEPVGKA